VPKKGQKNTLACDLPPSKYIRSFNWYGHINQNHF